MDHEAFVRAHTSLVEVPYVGFSLHLATEVTPLWHATEEWLRRRDVPPPFWAFPWIGGLGLARYVLDVPSSVRGLRVLDFATGSGLVAIAAKKAGAREVVAVDIDPFAIAACRLNAAAAEVDVDAQVVDRVGTQVDADVVLAGDVLYERVMSEAVVPWLHTVAERGTRVLVGDPRRAYSSTEDTVLAASYRVPTLVELEGKDECFVDVRILHKARA
jgi:predicted nicotinamide N-methyase